MTALRICVSLIGRAIQLGATVPPPDGLAAAVADGDRLKSLRALRDRLAADLDVCESMRDVAALSQRLMDVLAQIAAVEAEKPEKQGTALDELAARRRAAGLPDASGEARASRGSQRR